MPMQSCPPNDENFHPFMLDIAHVDILRGITMKICKYDTTTNLATHLKAYLT